MFQTIFLTLSLIAGLATSPGQLAENSKHLLSEKNFSLEKRYNDKWVSDIFKDNILLATAYLRGFEKTGDINWEVIRKPYHYEFTLKKDEVFAFHDDVLPQFEGKVVKSTHSHFNSDEGYKSDGWLVGDGVCHLASFINMAAREAGLEVVSPTRHDFAAIPEVPKEFGVAIYANPLTKGSNALQNLYIKNNREKPVEFDFDYNGKDLKISVFELDK